MYNMEKKQKKGARVDFTTEETPHTSGWGSMWEQWDSHSAPHRGISKQTWHSGTSLLSPLRGEQAPGMLLHQSSSDPPQTNATSTIPCQSSGTADFPIHTCPCVP